MAKLVYQTNFHRQYITVHDYNSVGTELVDPITIYVGENEVVRTKLAKGSTTQQIVKAHFNVGSSIVTTTESGDFISKQIASDVDGLTNGATSSSNTSANGSTSGSNGSNTNTASGNRGTSASAKSSPAASGGSSATAKTGDALPVTTVCILALASLAIAFVARRKKKNG